MPNIIINNSHFTKNVVLRTIDAELMFYFLYFFIIVMLSAKDKKEGKLFFFQMTTQ